MAPDHVVYVRENVYTKKGHLKIDGVVIWWDSFKNGGRRTINRAYIMSERKNIYIYYIRTQFF